MACAILERISDFEPLSRSYSWCRYRFAVPPGCTSAKDYMSSANHRLVIFLPPMLTFPLCSSRTSGMICLRKMLKRVGEQKHHCLTSIVVLNHSPRFCFFYFIPSSGNKKKMNIGLNPLLSKHYKNSIEFWPYRVQKGFPWSFSLPISQIKAVLILCTSS